MTKAAQITKRLNGHWYGSYGLAMCPAHENTRTPALSIRDGTEGRLMACCHAGCSYRAVLEALRDLGVLGDDRRYNQPSKKDLYHSRQEEIATAVKREAQALEIWRNTLPIAGTTAEAYLRRRGITANLPECLRFHPACWHGPSTRRLPAMVALVEGSKRLAVHRTYLRSDGSGKAELSPAKMMLGATAGGAVRLTGGAGPLVVAEGIETALSLHSGLLPQPAMIWAALSTSGISALRLPPVPHRLIIAIDGDDAGRAAGHKLAERAYALGWTVSLLPAPDGRDWNDILIMKGA